VEEDAGSDSSSGGRSARDAGRNRNKNTVIVRTTLRGRRLYLHRLEQLAQRILNEHGISGAELSILIAGDRKLRRLNRQYRNSDRPTDVLAFPQDTPYGRPGAYKMLGDVVVSADRAVFQARAAHTPVRDELMLLVAHGVLHLLGYDHNNGEDAATMRAAQHAALKGFVKGCNMGSSF